MRRRGRALAADAVAWRALVCGASAPPPAPPMDILLPVTGTHPDLLRWSLNVARLRLLRQTTQMILGQINGYVCQPPAPLIYCPSINY